MISAVTGVTAVNSLIVTPLCVDNNDRVRRTDETSPYTYRWQIEKSDTLQKRTPLRVSSDCIMGKIFNVYSFAGHLKIVCQDIFVWYSTHRQFEQTSKQSTAIHADKGFPSFQSGKHQANNQQTKIPPQIRVLHALVCSFGVFFELHNILLYHCLILFK